MQAKASFLAQSQSLRATSDSNWVAEPTAAHEHGRQTQKPSWRAASMPHFCARELGAPLGSSRTQKRSLERWRNPRSRRCRRPATCARELLSHREGFTCAETRSQAGGGGASTPPATRGQTAQASPAVLARSNMGGHKLRNLTLRKSQPQNLCSSLLR